MWLRPPNAADLNVILEELSILADLRIEDLYHLSPGESGILGTGRCNRVLLAKRKNTFTSLLEQIIDIHSASPLLVEDHPSSDFLEAYSHSRDIYSSSPKSGSPEFSESDTLSSPSGLRPNDLQMNEATLWSNMSCHDLEDVKVRAGTRLPASSDKVINFRYNRPFKD